MAVVTTSNTITASNGMTTSATYNVPFPQNGQEYGKAFHVSDEMMNAPDFEIMVLNMVMKDYQQAKMQNFPRWRGFPEIKTSIGIQGMQVAWYARVDMQDVFDTVEEEQLWNE